MQRFGTVRPLLPLSVATLLVLLASAGVLLGGVAAAQYTQVNICSTSTYYMSVDSTSSSTAAVEVISHTGVNSGSREETSTTCAITVRPNGGNSEIAIIAGFLDPANAESTTVRVGSGSSVTMQINTLYKSSSSITISHTLSSSGRGFRATVFGVPGSIAKTPICDHDGGTLPSNALTRVVSHATAGVADYSGDIRCEADVMASSTTTTTYGFFDFFDLESCCDHVQFNGETLSSTSVVAARGSSTAANNLVFDTDRNVFRDGFILDLFRVAGTATETDGAGSATPYLICDTSVASSMLGIIRSHPESGVTDYGNSVSCTMSISVPAGFVIAFYMEHFDLESCCDRLTVTYDGSADTSFTTGSTFASTNAGSDVQLSFTTDGSVTDTGFTLYYQIVSSTSSTISWSSLSGATSPSTTSTTTFPDAISTTTYTVCSSSSVTGVEAGVIFSHRDYGGSSYEDNYDNSLYCTLVVYPLDNNDFVHIYVDEIDLESADDLQVASGTSSEELTSIGETFVGQQGQSVRISFDTDTSVRRDGFKLLFQSSSSSNTRPFSWNIVSGAVDDPGSSGGGGSVTFPFGAIPGIFFAVVFIIIITVSVCINYKARRQRAMHTVQLGPPIIHGVNATTTNTTTSNTTAATPSTHYTRNQAPNEEPLPSYESVARTPNDTGSGATQSGIGQGSSRSGIAETPITAATFLSVRTSGLTSPGVGGGSSAYPPSPSYPPGPAYPPASPPTTGTDGAQAATPSATATAPSYADAPPSYNALFSNTDA